MAQFQLLPVYIHALKAESPDTCTHVKFIAPLTSRKCIPSCSVYLLQLTVSPPHATKLLRNSLGDSQHRSVQMANRQHSIFIGFNNKPYVMGFTRQHCTCGRFQHTQRITTQLCSIRSYHTLPPSLPVAQPTPKNTDLLMSRDWKFTQTETTVQQKHLVTHN